MRTRLLALLLLLPDALRAQDGAALVADALTLTPGGELVAEGNVQAFYEGTTLSARRVTYDPDTERLLIEGPIFLRDADGTVLAAERADLDARLEQGLLAGARLVLDRRLQIAADEARQADGVTTLTSVAATSCQVCPGVAPLWEIRAREVVRDEAAETITFEGAQFLVRGVPILWLPRIRLPEPGNERATGLLLPRLRGSGDLGLGVEAPFFLELGPSRDLTVTPFLSPATATLEARYRQAFLNGEIEVTGQASLDDLRPGELRASLGAEGAFDLGGTQLSFSGLVASDPDYLEAYGLEEGDVAESSLQLTRVDDASLLESEVVAFQDLGSDRAVPDAIGSLEWERRRPLGRGTLTWGTALEAVAGDGAVRDTARAGTFAGWNGSAVLPAGLLLGTEARLAVDAFRVADDGLRSFLRASPAVAATLRWPLVRQAGEVTDLLEPVASLGWSGILGEEPPNDDARLPELDEANLFALSRLPGQDAVEDGARLSLGLTWTRVAPGGEATLALGRVAGGANDGWLAAARAELAGGLGLEARTVWDEDWEPGPTDARLDWSTAALSLEAGFARVPGGWEPDLGGPAEEVSLAAEFRPSERWTLAADLRYDLLRDHPREVGIGVGWRNECVAVDLSASRRYTSAGDEGTTEFGLSVDLLGFSASDPRVAPGACRG